MQDAQVRVARCGSAEFGFESNEDYEFPLRTLFDARISHVRTLHVAGESGRRKTAFANALARALEYPHVLYHDFSVPEPPPTVLIGVAPDPDGALHGTLVSTADPLNSGFIAAAAQDQTLQTPLGITRVRVTFTSPGTYEYFCALHDELGMKGEVVVGP